MRDEIFKKPINKQFEFDESVVSVFDDMLARSVPFYAEITTLVAEFLSMRLKKSSKVCDLGCSTANLLLTLFKLRPDLILSGIDSSAAMIKTAKNKAKAYGAHLTLQNADFLGLKIPKNDAIILNFTLQFIRPPQRALFVAKIFERLNRGGVLIFSEKLIFDDKKFSLEMIKIYENYKQKQGYSAFEIAQKRQALENVLIPYTQNENIKMCLDAGFKGVELLFKWANFASFVAFK